MTFSRPLVSLAIVVVVITGAYAWFSQSRNFADADLEVRNQDHKTLSVAGVPLSVLVADTAPSRERGLSGKESLDPDEGMLFVFDAPDTVSFWMKDMLFPIDIIWIGADMHVVDTTEHLSPSTYPSTFSPRAPAQYVLEVREGWVAAHGIAAGSSVLGITQ